RACRRRRRHRGDRPRPRRAATRLRHAAGGPGTVSEFGDLARAIEATRQAAAAAARRPRREVAGALARAAARWRHDAEVSRRLPLEARLSPAGVSARVDAPAPALHPDATVAPADPRLGS